MTDEQGMRLALAAAAEVRGTTAPNPSVGAVLVRDGRVLGVGATRPVGGPHAEVMALAACRAAGEDPAGSTVYVTLEPCCHWGRTPPCTDALLAARVRRVVVGTLDPFPAVHGKGLQQLSQAGVEVTLGVLEPDCTLLIRGFARAIRCGLPEVCGVTDASPGVRATYDAVLRMEAGPTPTGARRVVLLAPYSQNQANAPIFDVPTLLLSPNGEERSRAAFEQEPPGQAPVWEAVLRACVKAGIHRLLVEDEIALEPLRQGGLVDARPQ